MEDLIYTYKKGKGWVIGPAVPSYTVEDGGYRYTFEHRRPEVGERFWYLSDERPYNIDGVIDFEKFFEKLKLSFGFMRPSYNSAVFEGMTPEVEMTFRFNDDNYTHVTLTVTKLDASNV